jgi:ferredoxin
MARKVALGQVDLLKLREFAKELRATHVMFATSDNFKNIYSIEYSLWCTGMPADQYNPMLEIYGYKPLTEPAKDVKVERLAKTDLPDVEKRGVIILEESKTVLTGKVDGCIECKKCMKACPEKAISIVRESDGVHAYVKSDRCAGTACRRCEHACDGSHLSLREFQIVQ